MVGDSVEVDIQKVDALRHQIDLVVVLPETGEDELEMPAAGEANRAP
jgi:ribonuclease R